MEEVRLKLCEAGWDVFSTVIADHSDLTAYTSEQLADVIAGGCGADEPDHCHNICIFKPLTGLKNSDRFTLSNFLITKSAHTNTQMVECSASWQHLYSVKIFK